MGNAGMVKWHPLNFRRTCGDFNFTNMNPWFSSVLVSSNLIHGNIDRKRLKTQSLEWHSN